VLTLRFQSGTLLIEGENSRPTDILPAGIGEFCRFDSRVQCWRAAAGAYSQIVLKLFKEKIPYDDQARKYATLQLPQSFERKPRFYQQEALDAWVRNHRRGMVVLPTGTGKSFLAQLAIASANRSTLVVVPTLDLLAQWVLQLKNAFGCPIGILGGGTHDIQDITVSTYDSALLTMDAHGDRFGLLVVDECHHLPGPAYSQIARLCIAPYRLGLTATPERKDGLDLEYAELLGPICYRKEITDLPQETVLSPYETIPVYTPLDEDEQALYQRERDIYTGFVRKNRISFSNNQGWHNFLMLCARSPEGHRAFQAYMEQKRIARSPRSKFHMVAELLAAHRHDRIILFTADNATAYQLGNAFALPVITHHTKSAERVDFLEAFRRGDYPVLVTSKVLNEGVDVPAANVGIVVSGSGSVREHVQRLGRILRPSPGKTAVLYELVSEGTSETYISERRRMHPAYGNNMVNEESGDYQC